MHFDKSHRSLGDGLDLYLISESCATVYKTSMCVPLCTDTCSLHRANTFPSTSWDLKLKECLKMHSQRKAKNVSLC